MTLQGREAEGVDVWREDPDFRNRSGQTHSVLLMEDVTAPDTLFSPLIEHAIELSAQWHDGTYRKSRATLICSQLHWWSRLYIPRRGTVFDVAPDRH